MRGTFCCAITGAGGTSLACPAGGFAFAAPATENLSRRDAAFAWDTLALAPAADVALGTPDAWD